MAMTWALSGSHDLVIKQGTLAVVEGAGEVKQRILIALLHHWQEYFLDVEAGVPWYELILGAKDQRLAANLIRSTILDVPGVVSIVALDVVLDRPLRGLSIFLTAEVTALSGNDVITAELVLDDLSLLDNFVVVGGS